MNSKEDVFLKYQDEDDQVYVLSDGDNGRVIVPKNRNVPERFRQQQMQPLTPAFRLLMMAILGLAPAGLGTLVLAPLAALWTVYACLTHQMARADRIRAALVLGIVAVLLGLAIPLSMVFLHRLS